MKNVFWVVLVLALSGCGGIPKGIEPIGNFDVDRYLGTWYEVARLDHRFERGLSNVSAQYSLKDNGQIKVINRGFKETTQEFSEVVGRAKFAAATDQGFLKVSFFGPFFGSYVVFEIDDDYSRAYIAGNDRSTLWFLSRTPQVSDAEMQAFVSRAESLGFAVDELIFVDQSLAD